MEIFPQVMMQDNKKKKEKKKASTFISARPHSMTDRILKNVCIHQFKELQTKRPDSDPPAAHLYRLLSPQTPCSRR